jgi:hypothetical protein
MSPFDDNLSDMGGLLWQVKAYAGELKKQITDNIGPLTLEEDKQQVNNYLNNLDSLMTEAAVRPIESEDTINHIIERIEQLLDDFYDLPSTICGKTTTKQEISEPLNQLFQLDQRLKKAMRDYGKKK